ncbi:NUDIX domain-containing protein [Parafrankia sp. BMG5.11]|uniref:NUDIX domain-containing protein n=1 Tax=Parafrankia sp. Ea1.12 TaxID=573499 RepID=UPI000DD38595|nr:NUDIX domain-containing protein [Parafrankia sp. Ea1.12]TCJ33985.1 NUDIX domain-containing protein [Parafrankia sp. BMG5.11]
MSELVEHVDGQDHVLGVVTRGDAVRQSLPHRIAATICRDGAGRILVLRRSERLTRFPGHYDVLVGGAVGVGESYEDAAARELTEELGLRLPVRFMFKFFHRDATGPVWMGVHEALVVNHPLAPDPEEISWHGWLTSAETDAVVNRPRFAPGGREAMYRYQEHRNRPATP